MGPQEFTRRLQCQLIRNRNEGFEPLHVRGQTGYLVKATLLSHGYTVIIKATTMEKRHCLEAEVENYCHLRSLQGQQIPVCLGLFKPRIAYWYHGELMVQMMILSWSGTQLQYIIINENSSFFGQERDKVLAMLQLHGVVQGDSEWHNILWNGLNHCLVVVDLEDIRWLKRSQALEPTSGNTRRGYRLRVGKKGKGSFQLNHCLHMTVLKRVDELGAVFPLFTNIKEYLSGATSNSVTEYTYGSLKQRKELQEE